MPSSSSSVDLTEEVAILRAQVARLELRVSQLEKDRSEGYELVSDTKSEVPPVLPVAGPVVCSKPVLPISDRERVLSGIGRWLRSALDGRRRGPSGRDSLPEPNRVYIIARDIEYKTYNPVLVVHRWSEAERLVKRKGELGDSIFVGLPAISDVEPVCKAAQLQLPVELSK